MWDQRFNTSEYIYGTAANDFLQDSIVQIPPGKVLSLGEGEGRNACYLAKAGYEVHAVDASHVGLQKAQALAAQQGVNLVTYHADLAEFDMGENRWDGIVSIFCHLPQPLRDDVYQRAVKALKPGGVMVIEAYSPAQLQHGTGGPKVVELLVPLAETLQALSGLTWIVAQEIERPIHEGELHKGLGAVVQILARKPISHP